MTPRPKKLLDQVRDAIRLKHYASSSPLMRRPWACIQVSTPAARSMVAPSFPQTAFSPSGLDLNMEF